MTEQELASNLKSIEEQREALVAQLEKVQSASSTGQELVEHIQAQLKDLDGEVIKIVVNEIVKSLKPYGVMMQSEVVKQKRTRKTKEDKTVTTIDGLVQIANRFGAKRDEDGDYTIYMGVDSKRSADKSVSTTGKWQQYLKEEYATNSEVIDNTTAIAGKFLVVASEMDLIHVSELGKLSFANTPDSEENEFFKEKPPLELNADLSKIGSELITETIMETVSVLTETEPVLTTPDLSTSKSDIIPIGSKIRTKAYGKWMEGTITKYVPEDLAKPYRAELDGLPIEGHLPADAIELLSELADLPL